MPVKAVPGASRDRIVGELDGALKVAVSAPAEKGRANKAIIALLARTLGVRRNQITLAEGAGSPRKAFVVAGMSADEARAVLARAVPGGGA